MKRLILPSQLADNLFRGAEVTLPLASGYKDGDRVWIAERFRAIKNGAYQFILVESFVIPVNPNEVRWKHIYRDDEGWRSAANMPQWASRVHGVVRVTEDSLVVYRVEAVEEEKKVGRRNKRKRRGLNELLK